MKDEKMKVEDVDDKCAMMNLPKFDGTSSGYSVSNYPFQKPGATRTHLRMLRETIAFSAKRSLPHISVLTENTT